MSAETPNVPAVLTTYLSKIALDQKYSAQKLALQRLPKMALYVYDAFLTQCAYLSRLAYNTPVLLSQGIKEGMEFSALDKNAIITQLEQDRSLIDNFTSNPTAPAAATPANANAAAQPCNKGIYIPEIGCSILQYVNPTSRINNRRTLFVIFKGTSTFEGLTELVKTAFNESDLADISTLHSSVDFPGKCYNILIDTYKTHYATIMDAILKYAENIDQIVLTGHSVGGSAATLFGFLLKHLHGSKPEFAKISIHIVSFGALRLFDKKTALALKEPLEYGRFTYDNIIGESDDISYYPAELAFPGVLDVMTSIGDVRAQFGDNFAESSDPESLEYNAPFLKDDIHPIMNDVYLPRSQAGGGKPETTVNTIKYACTGGDFCHANYMGISFMKVWELPQGKDREGLGILEYKMQDNAMFVTAGAAAAGAAAAGGGRTRKSRRGRFIRARQLRRLTRALKAAVQHQVRLKRA